MPETQTLTGYLGADVEIRDSVARWETRETTRWDPVAETHVTEEVDRYRRARPYGRVSLATHSYDETGRQITGWHQLVIWDLHRLSRFHVRLARKGDRVRVEGFYQTFTYTTDDGEQRQLERFIVTRYQTLRRKFPNGAVLSNRHLHEALPEATETPQETPEASPTATPRRRETRAPLRSTYTTRATVESRTTHGQLVALDTRTASGRTSRVCAVLGHPLGDALAWLEPGDTVRLTFQRRDGSAPALVNVAWDWQGAEPAERTSPTGETTAPRRTRTTPAPRSQSRPRGLAAFTLGPVALCARLATDPETCQGWRAASVETDAGELFRVGAQIGTAAAAELAHLQEGDRVRVEGRRLPGDRVHAHHLEPAYLRGTVPTFTRDQQYRPELYR